MTEFRPQRFQVLPPVVKNLLIINTLLAVLQFVLFRTTNIYLPDYLGLHYFRSDLFHSWQFVTHMFMHGDPTDLNLTVMHLFSNMFALWMFGSLLENVWGPRRFLIFYFVCGIGAALCYMAVLSYQMEPLLQTMPHEYLYGGYDMIGNYHRGYFDMPMVGASGAVFGILFAFGYLFPNTMLYFFFLVPIKAKWVVAGYAAFELYSGIKNNPGDEVAHFAHLGGMLFAFILLKIWNRRHRNKFF